MLNLNLEEPIQIPLIMSAFKAREYIVRCVPTKTEHKTREYELSLSKDEAPKMLTLPKARSMLPIEGLHSIEPRGRR